MCRYLSLSSIPELAGAQLWLGDLQYSNVIAAVVVAILLITTIASLPQLTAEKLGAVQQVTFVHLQFKHSDLHKHCIQILYQI